MMQKRHSEELNAKLDELYMTGMTSIEWSEIYYWYGIQRISKNVWRDLSIRWEEICSEDQIAKKVKIYIDAQRSVYWLTCIDWSKEADSLNDLI
jgi:hypothetical protein